MSDKLEITNGTWEGPVIIGRNALGKPQATVKAKRPTGLYDIVATVFGRDIPQARANAQLIEAAPEMYKMLLKYREALWALMDHCVS